MIDNNKGNNKHYTYNDIYIYLKEISNFEFLISNSKGVPPYEQIRLCEMKCCHGNMK